MLECLCHLMNLTAASRSKNWQISECGRLLFFDSLTSFVIVTINKTVLFERVFLLIWQIIVCVVGGLRL